MRLSHPTKVEITSPDAPGDMSTPTTRPEGRPQADDLRVDVTSRNQQLGK
jgi:hypothetical protein